MPDQPGIFVPPTMLAISSQVGWFRERVAATLEPDEAAPGCSVATASVVRDRTLHEAKPFIRLRTA
jgi:hypothetical protein